MFLAICSKGRSPAEHFYISIFSLITQVKDGKLGLVSEPALYVGTGKAICRSGFLLYSILRRCMFSSVSARFDHTQMLFLQGLFAKLSDEALVHLCNVTASGALKGSAVPEADDLPPLQKKLFPVWPHYQLTPPKVLPDGVALGTSSVAVFARCFASEASPRPTEAR